MNLEQTFALLEQTAVKGERCPPSHRDRGYDQPKLAPPVDLVPSDHLQALARAGKIRIDISGKNYRQVTILVGPYAGKQTAPNPNPKARIWQTITASGRTLDVISQRVHLGPSAPRDYSRAAPFGLRDLKERK